MKKAVGIFAGLLVAVIAVGIGIIALSNSSLGPVSDAAQQAKAAAANVALDVTDVKGQLKNTIDDNKGAIAAATGLTPEQVDEAVANLAIESWEAATLPADANATGTYDASSLGVDGSITTYDNPGYVTLTALGQDITLAVPESAQTQLALLASTL